MSDLIFKVNVAEWVEKAKDDPVAYQQRQTVEITLNAIARTAPLRGKMFLKGGILMGLAYDSPRQTADIDLTTALEAEGSVGDEVRKLLDSEFPRAAAELGYADLIVKTHSVKHLPKGKFPNANFPALKLKIASAKRRTPQERALRGGKASDVMIDVDISFNEPLPQIHVLKLTGGQELHAYGLADLIAEKFRAMLQQVPRHRNRPQDVYDLDRLIARNEIDDERQAQILDALVEKCQARRIKPLRSSLNAPEIKRRAGAAWRSMELELGEVPDFEGCFARVAEFYRNLPWAGMAPVTILRIDGTEVL